MVLDSHSYDFFPTNALLSAGSAALAFITNLDPALTFVLPIAFFVVGKAIDVGLRIYFETKKK